MKFIDLHCDTLMKAFMQKKPNVFEMPDSMLDVKRMKQGGGLAQFFAIFLLPEGFKKRMNMEPVTDDEYIDYLLNAFDETMTEYKDYIAPAYNYDDIVRNEEEGRMSGLVTFEDGRAIDGSLEKLKRYCDRGIRLISLTWNFENCFGFPNSKDPKIMEKGLKDFGKEAVQYMNELGIIVDVSHLSDGGFYDVAKISSKPFVASHSNCRAISPHQRNMTDDMIKILAEKGGVVGINFGPEFLNEDITVKDSTVELMSKHIQWMINLGGEECVALGSDFDGISGNLEVNSVDKVPMIFDRLKTDGIRGSVIEKIAYKNALRVIKDTCR